jgi:hypothetical protein
MGRRSHARCSFGAVLIAIVLFLGIGSHASLARADEQQQQPSLADDLSGSAKADYLAGRTLFLDGDFASALVKFQSALDTSKDMRLLWNLGACHRGLRHYADAIREFERYIREGGPRVTDAERAEATQVITGLRPYVAAVSVHATEAGADVVLDGKEIGKTPLERFLVDIGQHTVAVKKTGFTDYNVPLTITGTQDIVLDVKQPHEGRVVVRASAGDMIAIDGRVVGAGLYEATLPSGLHKVRVTAPGKKTSDSEIMIEDGQLRTVEVTLQNSGGLPLWAWIGIGVAGATTATVAGYFLFRADDPTRPGPVVGTMQPGVTRASFW